MDLKIDVYLTTKKDSLPDLDTYKTEERFYQWKKQVAGVALERNSYRQISEGIIPEDKEIIEAFALIECPPGKMLEADEEVGEKLKDLFQKKSIPFNWSLTRDEKAQDKNTVSLELVVRK